MQILIIDAKPKAIILLEQLNSNHTHYVPIAIGGSTSWKR